MKKTGMVLTILCALLSLFWQIMPVAAATGAYQAAEVTATWDGTAASILAAPTTDYDYDYGDEGSVTFSLPWTFTFYGQPYSQLTADTNGNVWFGATGAAHSFDLASTGRGPVIAAWNNDLSAGFHGGVFIQYKTNPERVVIEWQTETYSDEAGGQPSNFAVVLYPDSTLRIDYNSFNPLAAKDFGSGLSKGDGTATVNLTSMYGSAFTLGARSFRFSPSQKIVLSTQTAEFGAVYAGTTSQPRTITVTNSGTDNLGIGSVGITGGSSVFTVVAGSDACSGVTLAPAQSCTVQVAFAPAVLGQQSAKLTVSSDDALTPTVDVSLTGTGSHPALTVAKDDIGSGTVTSSPAGIACGTACSGTFTTGSSVTLTAAPDAGSAFTGWSGACSGTDTCTVTLDAAKEVTASFTPTTPPSVTIGSPTGAVPNSRPLLSYTASPGTAVVKVDGAAVGKISGDLLDTLADGTHLVRVEVTNRAGYTGAAESAFAVDTAVPTITTVTPAASAVDVAVIPAIEFTFSEALDSASVGPDSIVLASSFGQVAGTVKLSADARKLSFKPLGQLGYNRDYTVTLRAGIRDLAGNAIPADNTSTFRTRTASADLVGLWQMDNDWSDASGNGNHGTANNGATYSTERIDGTMAGSLDGVDDYVTAGTSASLVLTTGMTISAWVYPTGVGSNPSTGGAIINKEGEYLIARFPDGTLRVILANTSPSWAWVNTNYVAPLNTWTHLAWTYSSATGEIKLHANGSLVFSQTGSGNIGDVNTSANELRIGGRQGPNQHFSGLVDKVAIYKRALTTAEISGLFNDRPRLTLTSPGQTVKYGPGQAGTATISVTHPTGVTTLDCTASGAASGSLTLSFDTPQPLSNQEFAFQIAADAAPNAAVTIACSTTDNAGNIGNATINLTIADVVAPFVASTSIADYSPNVVATTPITLTFSESLAPATVTATSVVLTTDDGANQQVTGTVSLSGDGKSVTFTPAAALAGNTAYRLTATSAVTDVAGNPVQEFVLHFSSLPALPLTISGKGSSSSPYLLTTGRYGNITIDNSYVVFDGAVYADAISLTNGSVLSHYGATTTATYKLDVTATSISVDSTSKIDASGKGYLGAWQGGNGGNKGRTIGNVAGVNTYEAGSYGGLGAGSSGGNTTYGSLSNPADAGSGGGGDPAAYAVPDYVGGNGGGIVKVTAGSLSLAGSILADGNPPATKGGAGSGGSILLNVGTLSGSGSIYARGGSESTGFYNTGGGGRIAIYYDSMTLPVGNVSAAGGKSGTGIEVSRNGGAGTIYLKDNARTKPELIVNNTGTSTNKATTVPGGDYVSLTVTGGAIVSATSGITTEQDLSLTDTQLTVNGPLGLPGNLSLTNSTLNVSGGVTVPGSLTMYKGNLTLKDSLSATGSITLQNQSVLSHYGATTTAAWKLDVTASMVSVDATSRIDVSGKGYLGGRQSGNWSSASGMTVNPANGSIVTGVTAHNGGGYGGLGACGTGTCSSSYGDQTNPLYAGSGGGGDPDMSGSSAEKLGGNGGGVLKLTAGTLSLAGSIKADGGPGAQYGAGGSGGSVLLNVGSLTGSGSISAKGGAKGGGGGRIAIYYDSMTVPVGNISTTGGISGDGSNALDNGGAGTIYLKDNAKAKPALIIDNGGTATSYGTSVPGGNYLSFTSKGGAVVSASSGVTTEQDPLLTNTRLTVNGSLGLPGNLSLTNCTVSLTGSATVPGNLTMNNSSLTLRNILSVSGNISLQNQSVLAHEQTWLWSVWRLDITALTVTIDATSKIDVTGRGYLGGWQAYDGVIKGHTIGNVATVDLSQGGSYGGYGSGHSAGNSTYGSMTNPIDAGSGGGGGSCNPLLQSCFGGNGGGVVKITANSLSLAGDIKANGNPCNGYINANSTCYGGSGSGGSVLLNVGTLSGSGRISANGGPGSSGGGGGRVAVYYDTLSLPVGNITSAGGLGGDGSNPANNGGAGTVYLLQNVLPLTVTKSGAGIGTVQSTPAGITCGATCSGNFVKNSNVTLTATPNAGSTFDGWSGACIGTGNCTVTMDAAKSVTASFALIPPPTVTISSPVGVISNNRPLLQYSVSAGTVVVKMDGVVVSKVSGDPLDLLVDGLHTIRVEATNSGVTGYAESIVTIDTVVPTVTVDTLPTIVKTAAQTLSGSMEAGSSVSVTVTAGTATLGTVTYPTSTTWQCVASNLTVGTNGFTITAQDPAGNSSAKSLSVTYALPLSLELSVPSIAASFQGTVALAIGNIDPAGSNVLVEQLVDANRNGLIDAGDYPIRSFPITDGVAAVNPNTQGDEDSTSNGSIATTLNYALAGDIYHAPGNYLFRVTNGTETASASLTVSPVTQLQYVSGTVTDGTNPVPGAIVRLLDKWQRPVAWAIADETGHYTLDVPTPGEYRIVPIAYGSVADPAGTPLTIADGQNLTGHNLTATAGTIHLSGKLKKDQTNDPVAGVWVQAIGANVLGYAITGTDGSYDLPLPAGEYDVIAVADATLPNPAARGYLAATKQPQHVSLQLDTAGIDIALVPADIAITGKVADQTGSPLSGVPILGRLAATADAREPAAFTTTDGSGNYTLVLAAENENAWTISLDDTVAQPLGYLGNAIRNFSTAGTLTGNDLVARPVTTRIQGTVRDSNANPLGNVDVQLRNADASIVTHLRTASDGTYRFGAYGGDWYLNAFFEHNGPRSVGEQTVTLIDGQAATIDFVVDSVPPVVTITSPTATTTPDNTPKLTYTVSEGSVVVKVDNVVVNKVSGDSLDLLANGEHTVVVESTDAAGNINSASVTFIVNYALPAIGTSAIADGTVGVAFNQTLAASGGVAPYDWTLGSGALPAELTLDRATGTISGTPSLAGTYTFTVQLTDSDGVGATQPFTLTVYTQPTVTTAALADGYLSTAYGQTVSASGGKTPYSWSLIGSPPASLALDVNTGAITGIPTATGTSSFTVQVKDANNVTALMPLGITVYALPSITSASCPNGTVGTTYSCTLTATGGKTPLAWSISGSLPANLALNSDTGVISGTPTVAGTSNFTVLVADANLKSASTPSAITVAAPPAVALLNAWTNLYSAAPNNTSATNLNVGSFTVGSGTNRLLLVAVVMEIGTAANPTISASYGGVALTQAKVTANTQREIVWVGYLRESQIGSGSKALTVTYSGATGNVSALHAKWGAFSGVNQTIPIVASGGTNTASTSATFGSTINYVVNGMTTVVAGNGGTPATGTLTATPPFTAGAATTTNSQTSRTFTTAKHTTNGSFAGTAAVTWSGTTSSRSGVVVVSLQP